MCVYIKFVTDSFSSRRSRVKSATRSKTHVLPFSVSCTAVHFSLRHSKLPLNWRAPFGRKTQTNTIGPSTSSL